MDGQLGRARVYIIQGLSRVGEWGIQRNTTRHRHLAWGISGTCTECEHGERVCEGSPQADGGEFFPVLSGHLGCLADAGDPERDHEEHTDEELGEH
jgi:hypothetical protein